MTGAAVAALLWFCVIGCGLIGGLFFAFSTFVMTALGRIDPRSGTAAMNAINTVILRSLFMPLFFGTTLASAALAAIALFELDAAGAGAMLAGGAIYVLGMFVCTIAFNVPLNNALQAVDAGGETALPVWQRYLTQWTRWNHVRTVASVVSCGLFVYALVERG